MRVGQGEQGSFYAEIKQRNRGIINKPMSDFYKTEHAVKKVFTPAINLFFPLLLKDFTAYTLLQTSSKPLAYFPQSN